MSYILTLVLEINVTQEMRTMAKYGYARVSTLDQSNDVQIQKLADYGCEVIREERASGTSRVGRPELETLLQFIREGDQLVVWKLDRLARDLGDLKAIQKELDSKRASLVIVDQNIDTSSATGKAFLDMLGVFAEFETNLRRERQMAGIAKAKEAGMYTGAKTRFTPSQIDEALVQAKGNKSAAAKLLGCTYRTILRYCQAQVS